MIKDLRILAVVPARGGSKGVKLKNIRTVGGKPLVTLVASVVKEIEAIDSCVVSTDHPEIVKISKESGLSVPFLRPEEISGDRIGDWDVLNHALLAAEDIDGVQYDIIVMLQPTCPLRKADHVMAAIDTLVQGGYDAVWTVNETDSKHHPLKQLIIENDLLDYYDPEGKKIIARQQLEAVYHRNGAAYAITRDCLLKKHSIKGEKTGVVVIDEPLISIDTELDFALCEFYLEWVQQQAQEV